MSVEDDEIPDDEVPHESNALMRYGRALVWRMIAEMFRRYPHDLTVREAWIHDGSIHAFELGYPKASRTLYFHNPTPEGSMGMVGYLPPELAQGPLGIRAWQATIGEFSRAVDGRTVLDDLGKQLSLGPRKGIPPTEPHVLSWRVVAGFMTLAITGRRSWDLVCGRSYGDWPLRRTVLIDAFPEARDHARSLPGVDDPAAEMWFLVEDPEGHVGLGEPQHAVACLVPRTSMLWPSKSPPVTLMEIYAAVDRDIWSVVVAAMGSYAD